MGDDYLLCKKSFLFFRDLGVHLVPNLLHYAQHWTKVAL